MKLFDLIDETTTHDNILSHVQSIFDLILNQNKWINEFYRHPLGFFYCRLAERKDRQIRLHIWEKDYQIKDDLFIHDHYYDLYSWVLCGKILDFSYKVSPLKKSGIYSKFVSGYVDSENNRMLKRTDEFQQVKKIAERTILKGDKYSIPKGSYHSNKIFFDSSEVTVTLVFTNNHKENHSPNVIGLYENEIYLEDIPIPIPNEKILSLIKVCVSEIFES